MHSSHRSLQRRRQARPCPEALETRSLLTGGSGNTFALVPGTITQAGGSAAVSFTIDPKNFTIPNGKLVLGIDVIPAKSSNLKPVLKQVNTPAGTRPRHVPVVHTPGEHAVLVNLTIPAGQTAPLTFSVVVSAQSKTSGNFLLGFYLPGDANGNGVVDSTDVTAISTAMFSKSSATATTKYTFSADANRDGRITPTDLSDAIKNLGVVTSITPVVTANLDPASVTGVPSTRTTTIQNVHFSGTGAPGAKITYSEINHLTTDVSATVDSSGKYSLMENLAPGMNTFKVSSADLFGQTISGQISPVTFTPNGQAVANDGLPLGNLAATTNNNNNTGGGGSTPSGTG